MMGQGRRAAIQAELDRIAVLCDAAGAGVNAKGSDLDIGCVETGGAAQQQRSRASNSSV